MQMTKPHFIVFIALLHASAAFGDSFTSSININGKEVSVHIESTDDTGITVTNGKPWLLEKGHYAIGGWPADPKGRIISFTVRWGANEYKVPKELYSDVFNSLLKTKRGWWDNGGVLIRTDHDQSHILVELESSHVACCGYVVQWLISKNGEVTRFVDTSIP